MDRPGQPNCRSHAHTASFDSVASSAPSDSTAASSRRSSKTIAPFWEKRGEEPKMLANSHVRPPANVTDTDAKLAMSLAVLENEGPLQRQRARTYSDGGGGAPYEPAHRQQQQQQQAYQYSRTLPAQQRQDAYIFQQPRSQPAQYDPYGRSAQAANGYHPQQHHPQQHHLQQQYQQQDRYASFCGPSGASPLPPPQQQAQQPYDAFGPAPPLPPMGYMAPLPATAYEAPHSPSPPPPMGYAAPGSAPPGNGLWKQQSDRWDQLAAPHTPRVNSSQKPAESSTVARARLDGRLKLYDLCERNVKGDGNCQFRAVSDQLFRTTDMHEEVRRAAVHQLRSQPQFYRSYVPDDYSQYCWNMESAGEWGDHVTLQAISDAYGVRINVLSSYPEAAFISITPKEERTQRVLYLSFWAEVHYNSLYPRQEPPKSQKLLGSKKLYRFMNPGVARPISA